MSLEKVEGIMEQIGEGVERQRVCQGFHRGPGEALGANSWRDRVGNR